MFTIDRKGLNSKQQQHRDIPTLPEIDMESLAPEVCPETATFCRGGGS